MSEWYEHYLQMRDLEDSCSDYLDRSVEGIEEFQEDHQGDE
jgi:hypothetical protein